MSIGKIAILLEIVGFMFEAVFARILYPKAIERISDTITRFTNAVRGKILPALPIPFSHLAGVVLLVLFIDALIVWGLLGGGWMLFSIGTVVLIVSLLMVLLNRETRQEQIPKGTNQWLFPLYILWVTILLCVGIPLLLGPPVFLRLGLNTVSFVLQLLAKPKSAKWIFLVLGILMLLSGLILEFITSP